MKNIYQQILLNEILLNKYLLILNSLETDVIDIYIESINYSITNAPQIITFYTITKEESLDIKNKILLKYSHYISAVTNKRIITTNNTKIIFNVLGKKITIPKADQYFIINISQLPNKLIEKLYTKFSIEIHPDSKIIMNSINNKSNQYYKIFLETENGEYSLFKSFRYYYWMCNDLIDAVWIKSRIKLIKGPEQFSNLYDLCYINKKYE